MIQQCQSLLWKNAGYASDCGCRRRERYLESISKCPSIPPPVSQCVTSGLGAHLQDPTTAETSISQEKELHINMGETQVLMNNDATVVACLKKQGGMVSLDMCRLVQEVNTWSKLLVVITMAIYILGKKLILQTS